MAKYRHKRDGDIVEAEQFVPSQHPWPEGVISWDTMPYRPRDMSWGYIETVDGKKHVQAHNWIITFANGTRDKCSQLDFPHWYAPVGSESGQQDAAAMEEDMRDMEQIRREWINYRNESLGERG